MFSSNSVKIFFIIALLCFSSCSYWRGQSGATPTPTPFVAEELKSEIPFLTKEPNVYQTEIVITGADNLTEKMLAARNNNIRLLVFDFQGKNELAILQTNSNQSFLVATNKKTFAENTAIISAASENSEDFFNGILFNNQTNRNFETLETENALSKYRVTFGEEARSEVLIFFDEKINLPVRQEFYSGTGESKNLVSTVELKNFSLQIDPKLFEIPKDYRKVSIKELQDAHKRVEK